jgi:hypothetical protein
MAKRLREILPESLFEPKAKDQKVSWRAHKELSDRNSVDDYRRSDRPGSADRAGNPRSGVYTGSTKIYNRAANRMGYNADDDSDSQAFDFGRAAGVNAQAKPGLTQTSVPVVVTTEGEIVFFPEYNEEQLTEAVSEKGAIFPHLDLSPDSHKTRMVHSVTSYDRSRQNKKDYNHYALGHYLAASDRAHQDMLNGVSPTDAINRQFNGALARRLHKHLGTSQADK